MLSPTRKDIYEKLVNPKPKRMIDPNTQWFLLFTEWVAARYTRMVDGWRERYNSDGHLYTTVELLKIYEAATGTKAPKFEPTKPQQ